VRAYQRVLDQIEDRIGEGRLRAGDRLPGERELAEAMTVSRGSVREALRILESMGIVTSQVGRGPDSGSVVNGEPTEALSNLLRLHLLLSRFELDDLLEARIQLESFAATKVALQAPAADLSDLTCILDQMDDEELSPAAFNALDADFHVALVAAADNRLLRLFMHSLREVTQAEMARITSRITRWTPVASRLRDEHRKILESIGQGDGDGASRLIEAHIHDFYHTPWPQSARGGKKKNSVRTAPR
jgi:DNA-binding FadR family transcriptional regulator